MRSPGINGGELRGQLANPGLPGKMAVITVCMCVCISLLWFMWLIVDISRVLLATSV